MQKLLSCLLFTLFSLIPAYAVETPAVEQDQKMPESYTKWEKENQEREVKEESRFQELWTKTLLLLVVILALLFIATWFMKRSDRFRLKDPAQKSRISIIEKKVLSQKAMLYLVEIDGQKMALSETATNGVQMLHHIPTQTIENK